MTDVSITVRLWCGLPGVGLVWSPPGPGRGVPSSPGPPPGLPGPGGRGLVLSSPEPSAGGIGGLSGGPGGFGFVWSPIPSPEPCIGGPGLPGPGGFGFV